MRDYTCRLESRCSPVPLFARMKVLVVDSSASFEAEAHLFGRLARNASQVRGRQTRERGRLTQSSGQARCDRAGAHLIPRTGARASRRQASRSPPIRPNVRPSASKAALQKSCRKVVEPRGCQNCTFYPHRTTPYPSTAQAKWQVRTCAPDAPDADRVRLRVLVRGAPAPLAPPWRPSSSHLCTFQKKCDI